MKTKKWYFKNNYELYNVLYEDNRFILVQNNNTKLLSFGLIEDFGTLLGFPVNQSCLNNNQCINILNRFIKIDKQYGNFNNTIDIYKAMIKKIKEVQLCTH